MKKIIFGLLVLVTLAPLGACAQRANKKEVKKDIAVQLYSARDVIKSSADGSGYADVLAQLAQQGYTAIETANYNDGKFYGRTPEQFKQDVEAAGLKVLSAHTGKGLSKEELASGDFSESMKWWDKAIADHKAAGMKYIVTPAIFASNMKELETICQYFNEIGRRCKAAGIQYGYHNHDFEFKKIEDKAVMLDYMLENTDPELVFFQMDVYWVVMGKMSPVDYFNKYPGRWKLLHIKDKREIGQSGMVGFDAIFNNAKTAGVEQIVVEVEEYSMPVMESIGKSIEYLKAAPFVPASYTK
jgi:sugar phosphate isomerase/epimerase